MKTILIITLIIYSSCKTSEYYTKCKDGAPEYDNRDHSVSECNGYSKEGSYCCLLSFTISNDKQYVSLFRALEEKEYLCIGISKEGYNKISDVIKEIEKEASLSSLKIDCNSKNLNIFILLSYLLFFILI